MKSAVILFIIQPYLQCYQKVCNSHSFCMATECNAHSLVCLFVFFFLSHSFTKKILIFTFCSSIYLFFSFLFIWQETIKWQRSHEVQTWILFKTRTLIPLSVTLFKSRLLWCWRQKLKAKSRVKIFVLF